MIILILWFVLPLLVLFFARRASERPLAGSRSLVGARYRVPARLTARQRRFEWDMFECGPDRHAIPGSDRQRHRVSPDCPCAPGDAPVEHLDHTFGQLYVHHQTAASQRA